MAVSLGLLALVNKPPSTTGYRGSLPKKETTTCELNSGMKKEPVALPPV